MLTKIIFTLAVIIGVVLFFRTRPVGGGGGTGEGGGTGGAAGKTGGGATQGASLSPRVLAYGVLGALAGISILFFVLHRRAENRIVTIRVISDGVATAHYRARHKSIAGRNFVTLDGARVTLGDSERMELIEP